MKMKKVYFIGGEILNNVASDMHDFMQNLENVRFTPQESPIVYQHSLDRKCLVGIDSYSKLALHPVGNLMNRMAFLEDSENIGTVFSSEFGPMQSNMKVLRDLIYKGADFVSPKKFTTTVANICLGQICLKYGFKGLSTMFVGSSPLPYSFRALRLGRGKSILLGGVDEFQTDFYKDFDCHRNFKYGKAEGAAAIYLANEDLIPQERLTSSVEILSVANIIGGDLSYEVDRLSLDQDYFIRGIKKVLERANVSGREVDEVFMISNADPIMGELEEKAVKYIIPNAKIWNWNKSSKTGLLPASLQNLAIAGEYMLKVKEKKTILVNGLTANGQYTTVLLRRNNAI